MSVIRAKKDRQNPYVQISRKMLDDPNLSLRTKGFIAHCLSKPDDWQFYVEQLVTVLKESKTSIYSAIKEAEKNGYCIKFQNRDEKGRVQKVEYIISDSKDEVDRVKDELKLCLPLSGFPLAEDPLAENVPLLKNEATTLTNETTNYPPYQEIKNENSSSSFLDLRKLGQLEELGLAEGQKKTLYREFTDEQILQGIKYYKAGKKEPKDLGAYLYQACKGKWQVAPKKQEKSLSNKEFVAKNIAHWDNGQSWYGVNVAILNKHVEFVSGQKVDCIAYDEIDFMDRIRAWARRLEPALEI